MPNVRIKELMQDSYAGFVASVINRRLWRASRTSRENFFSVKCRYPGGRRFARNHQRAAHWNGISIGAALGSE